jgi:SAM-dependent methyltransferase
MDRSRTFPEQVRYWDRVAGQKRFSRPLRIAWLTRYVGPSGRILDLGCGHGRILAELLRGGYSNIVGIDFSFQCCRSQLSDVRLVHNDGRTIPLQKHSLDVVLLFAVLTCIPPDEEQRELLSEISRVLRPGGLLYISDLLLNRDLRNLQRYDRYASEYGTYGIFELTEGVVVHHHRKAWIEELTRSFDQLEFETFEVRTMNGNKAEAFQYLCRVPDTQANK